MNNTGEEKKKGGTEVNRKWTCCRLRPENTLVSTSRFYIVLQPWSTCHPPPITGKLKCSLDMWKGTWAARHTTLNCDQTLAPKAFTCHQLGDTSNTHSHDSRSALPLFQNHLLTSCWQGYVSYYISFWCKHWPQLQWGEKIGEHGINRLKPQSLWCITNGSLSIPIFQSENSKIMVK